VLLTAGRNVDLSKLEPLPSNAEAHSYISQAEILPRASVVVGHGGSGSTWGALAHGCPVVCLPQAADQFENGAAAEAAGAGLSLLPNDQGVEEIRAALRRVLGDESFASAAARIAEEIAAMPTADEAAAALFGG
jgi:MGT family glycosyltransferase